MEGTAHDQIQDWQGSATVHNIVITEYVWLVPCSLRYSRTCVRVYIHKCTSSSGLAGDPV